MNTQIKYPIVKTIVALVINALLITPTLAAETECGQVQLLEAGSVGVTINNSSCEEKSRITVGSTVALTTGSRMWLKFDPNTTGESFQLICQNKSANEVNLEIAGNTAPWIVPKDLKNCSAWNNNKLSCEDNNGAKNSFFCAIAGDKTLRLASAPEQTTSVKLRSISPKLISVDDIVKDINAEIQLCKDLYGVSSKLEMSWTISSSDMIKDLRVDSNNKDLVSCVESVAKQANANQELTIKHAF